MSEPKTDQQVFDAWVDRLWKLGFIYDLRKGGGPRHLALRKKGGIITATWEHGLEAGKYRPEAVNRSEYMAIQQLANRLELDVNAK